VTEMYVYGVISAPYKFVFNVNLVSSEYIAGK